MERHIGWGILILIVLLIFSKTRVETRALVSPRQASVAREIPAAEANRGPAMEKERMAPSKEVVPDSAREASLAVDMERLLTMAANAGSRMAVERAIAQFELVGLLAKQGRIAEAVMAAQVAQAIAEESGDDGHRRRAARILATLYELKNSGADARSRLVPAGWTEAREKEDPSIPAEALPLVTSSVPTADEAAARDQAEIDLKARLKRTYADSEVFSAPKVSPYLMERAGIAVRYQSLGFPEEAEKRFADLLHEYGDSTYVQKEYAGYLAQTRGEKAAIRYLREKNLQTPNDLFLRVSLDTAEELALLPNADNARDRLYLEIGGRLQFLNALPTFATASDTN